MRELQRRFPAVVMAVAVVAFACRPPSNAPRPDPAPRPFFFIQMSDPQFGFFTANADFARETVNFEKAIGIANRLRPAFVVITGDLTHRVGDAAQIAEFKRIAAQLDKSIPLYNVSGNHDVGQIPTPELLAGYRANYGPDRYLFSHGTFVGVVINSSLFKDGTGAPVEAAAQEAWLRTTLDSLRRAGRKPVVFQHHSWFLENPDEPDQYYNLPIGKRRAFLQLFREGGVSRVFAGHYHRNAFGVGDGDLQMVTSGPVGRPMGADPSGLRIVTVTGDRIEHRYHALDSVPVTVIVPTSESMRDSALRVMTFNIAAGNGNLARIAATIREANPDLVALQEVDVHWNARSNFADQASELSAQLGMAVRFAPIYRLPGADAAAPGGATREYGVALLSRHPIAAWRNDTLTRLSTLTEKPVPAPMPGFLAATVLVRGSAVRVFNTHTDYRPDPAVRVKQVAEMLALIGEPRTPTLLFGDLNAPPEAPEMKPLLIRLRDAWPTENGDGFTYPATKPVKRIDYVLTSPHFRVVSARVPVTNASDHRPVVVELVRTSRP